MKSISLPVLILLLTGATVVFSIKQYRNPFEAVQGCLQYDNPLNYDDKTLEYFATDNFRHVGRTETSKYIRVGIVGLSDGKIRYGNVPYPYEGSVIEIYLSGFINVNSQINRHTRSNNSEYINTQLKSILTPNVVSDMRPLMFRLEVFDNGNVTLTKDGQKKPFLEFMDNYKLQLDYIAFSASFNNVFFYFDCPLNTDSNMNDDTVLLECELA
uniref:Farnesoic acid O-methyl transferase domain-containing protein n=1 Tax=Anopheles funestus TaxID=62324 RepID=A0A182RPT0_ANOFN